MILNNIKLSDKIATVFHPIHKSIRNKDYSEYWLKGGREENQFLIINNKPV